MSVERYLKYEACQYMQYLLRVCDYKSSVLILSKPPVNRATLLNLMKCMIDSSHLFECKNKLQSIKLDVFLPILKVFQLTRQQDIQITLPMMQLLLLCDQATQ